MTNFDLRYLSGFASNWESESLPNALPKGQNSPKKAPYGLYAEQLSGSAFTMARHQNLRSWLYRIFPSVKQGEFKESKHTGLLSQNTSAAPMPNQMRWGPLLEAQPNTNFIDAWQAIAFNGSCLDMTGGAIYLYRANTSMQNTYFYNSDGELLIVPYEGKMLIHTEFGKLHILPGEIACIPRGVKFKVDIESQEIAGYLLENFGSPFILPNLGPIGANGLANPRDFKVPVAAYEDIEGDFVLQNKYANRLWQANIGYSPLNVVAWHGNYAPYKYNLKDFNAMGTVSFDHPDPSIFTVLTSPSHTPGMANIDFVIFPERWMVAENTFRPPYYHRNIMSEYMGLILGAYDAKADGFIPGGGSLHNCMSSHGPDAQTFLQAQEAKDEPFKQKDTLAFMFETSKPWVPTQWALESNIREKDYIDCWKDLPKQFSASDQPR